MAIWHLSAERLRGTPIPQIPLDDQQRIASFLDTQVPILDRAILRRQFQTRLEIEKNSERREHLVEPPSGHRIHLGLLVHRSRPINYGVLMPGPRIEVGVPLIEAGDVMRGPIEVDQLRLTEPAIELEFRRSRIVADDLVMAIRGSVGAVQIVPLGPAVMNVTRDAARISLQAPIANPRYVRHALSSRRCQDWIALRLTGSAVKGLNIADLRKIPVSAPPLQDQMRIAEELDENESYLSEVRCLMEKSINLIVDRRRSLITAAVTGLFDVTTAGSTV